MRDCFLFPRKPIPLQAEYYQVKPKSLVFSELFLSVSLVTMSRCFLNY